MNWLFTHRPYRLPFRTPVRTAHGIWPEREGLIVRLEDARGGVGYGEAATMPRFGTETVEEAAAACRAFGGTLDENAIAAVPANLPCLRNALASAARISSCDLPPPISHLPIAALLPAGRAALAAAALKADAGFRTFKWKVGVGDLEEEMGWFDELCAALPEGSRFRLDANGAWDGRQAGRWLKRCADRPVEWIEQPVAAAARGAADLLLGLAGDYPTPLALDESLVSEGDVDRWLGAGWFGVYVIKPSLFGDADRVLARLAKAKATVCFSSAFETAIGAKAGLQKAFAWTGDPKALGFGVWPLFADVRFNGPEAVPFLRWSDVERLNPEPLWTALT